MWRGRRALLGWRGRFNQEAIELLTLAEGQFQIFASKSIIGFLNEGFTIAMGGFHQPIANAFKFFAGRIPFLFGDIRKARALKCFVEFTEKTAVFGSAKIVSRHGIDGGIVPVVDGEKEIT